MLKDLGVKYVIIGHSERRQYFGETDITVNKKVHAALEAGLHPIVCVGESLEQRELGVTMDLISCRSNPLWLASVPKNCANASSLMSLCGPSAPDALPPRAGRRGMHVHPCHHPPYVRRPHRPFHHYQYGGSMNPGNAAELLAQPDIDGGLIGGAAPEARSVRRHHQRRKSGIMLWLGVSAPGRYELI